VLHHADALAVDLPGRWDYAWHDISSDEGHGHLCSLHAQLLAKYDGRAVQQGAWAFPREVAAIWPRPLLGARRRRRRLLRRAAANQRETAWHAGRMAFQESLR
jgi:hypothetical protein